MNAAWANRHPVGLYIDPGAGSPEQWSEFAPHLAPVTGDLDRARGFAGVLVAATHRLRLEVAAAMCLRPPVLQLGVGCRRGAAPAAVKEGVLGALERAGLSPLAVGVVASVEAKCERPAIRKLAETLGVPFRTFAAAARNGVAVPNPSGRVRQAVGTPSVAEAAATAAAGGTLILPKVKGEGWTLAVALLPEGEAPAEGKG